MTYAQRFGKYGIYTDGLLSKWFKDIDKAEDFWRTNIIGEDNACAEEWLEAYDEVTLVDMKSGETIHNLGGITK